MNQCAGAASDSDDSPEHEHSQVPVRPVPRSRSSALSRNQLPNVHHIHGSSRSLTSDSGIDEPQQPDVGQYKFISTIGRGNYATVQLAYHVVTKERVAIKRINKTVQTDDYLKQMYREVDSLKALKHPNIVQLLEVIETATDLYLVIEYAAGGELFEYLAASGRLKEGKARELFRQLLQALQYCHKKGIVHRDLKAENILLDADENVKIADFGFSRFFSNTKLGTYCGSPPYAAPELFKGTKYYGPLVDAWSLGVVLYVMVTGSRPFDGNNLAELRRNVLQGKLRVPIYVSSDCENLIRKLVVVNPRKRITLEVAMADRWVNCGFSEKRRLRPYIEPIEVDRVVLETREKVTLSPSTPPTPVDSRRASLSSKSSSEGEGHVKTFENPNSPSMDESPLTPPKIKKTEGLKQRFINFFTHRKKKVNNYVNVVPQPNAGLEVVQEENEKSLDDDRQLEEGTGSSQRKQKFQLKRSNSDMSLTSSKLRVDDQNGNCNALRPFSADVNAEEFVQGFKFEQLSEMAAKNRALQNTTAETTFQIRTAAKVPSIGTTAPGAVLPPVADEGCRRERSVLRPPTNSKQPTWKRLSATPLEEPCGNWNRQVRAVDRRSRQLNEKEIAELNAMRTQEVGNPTLTPALNSDASQLNARMDQTEQATSPASTLQKNGETADDRQKGNSSLMTNGPQANESRHDIDAQRNQGAGGGRPVVRRRRPAQRFGTQQTAVKGLRAPPAIPARARINRAGFSTRNHEQQSSVDCSDAPTDDNDDYDSENSAVKAWQPKSLNVDTVTVPTTSIGEAVFPDMTSPFIPPIISHVCSGQMSPVDDLFRKLTETATSSNTRCPDGRATKKPIVAEKPLFALAIDDQNNNVMTFSGANSTEMASTSLASGLATVGGTACQSTGGSSDGTEFVTQTSQLTSPYYSDIQVDHFRHGKCESNEAEITIMHQIFEPPDLYRDEATGQAVPPCKDSHVPISELPPHLLHLDVVTESAMDINLQPATKGRPLVAPRKKLQ